jgi:hypothetical protein
MRNSIRILDRKSEGKRSLDITTCRWQDNIEMDPKEIVVIVWTGLNCLGLEHKSRFL